MEVTGTVAPNCNGTYTFDGIYNGRESWIRTAGGFFMWWFPGSTDWIISNAKGGGMGGTDEWWLHDLWHEEGLFEPQDLALDTATAVHT